MALSAMPLPSHVEEITDLFRIRKPNEKVVSRARRQIKKSSRNTHEWTEYEMTVLITLVCHKQTFKHIDELSYFEIFTELNRILYGENNIPIEDVTEMLNNLMKCKAAIAFMERKGPITRVNRTMLQVWKRGLTFDGSEKEWIEWREEDEKRATRDRASKNSFGGSSGFASTSVGWGEETAFGNNEAGENASAGASIGWGGETASGNNEAGENASASISIGWGGETAPGNNEAGENASTGASIGWGGGTASGNNEAGENASASTSIGWGGETAPGNKEAGGNASTGASIGWGGETASGNNEAGENSSASTSIGWGGETASGNNETGENASAGASIGWGGGTASGNKEAGEDASAGASIGCGETAHRDKEAGDDAPSWGGGLVSDEPAQRVSSSTWGEGSVTSAKVAESAGENTDSSANWGDGVKKEVALTTQDTMWGTSPPNSVHEGDLELPVSSAITWGTMSATAPSTANTPPTWGGAQPFTEIIDSDKVPESTAFSWGDMPLTSVTSEAAPLADISREGVDASSAAGGSEGFPEALSPPNVN